MHQYPVILNLASGDGERSAAFALLERLCLEAREVITRRAPPPGKTWSYAEIEMLGGSWAQIQHLQDLGALYLAGGSNRYALHSDMQAKMPTFLKDVTIIREKQIMAALETTQDWGSW